MHCFPASITRRTAALVCLLFALLPLAGHAQAESARDRINQAVGRDLFVDITTLTDKVHTYKDIKKWIPVRGGRDALRMAYPERMKGSGISEEITVKLIIAPNGIVHNPIIENLKNKELAIPAILHAAKLRFEAPKVGGKAVFAEQKIKLICSEDPQFGAKK
jgi:hypothetical protein